MIYADPAIFTKKAAMWDGDGGRWSRAEAEDIYTSFFKGKKRSGSGQGETEAEVRRMMEMEAVGQRWSRHIYKEDRHRRGGYSQSRRIYLI